MIPYLVWVLVISTGSPTSAANTNWSGLTVIDNIASQQDCQDLGRRLEHRLPGQYHSMSCQQVVKVGSAK